jgi:methyl-accepting chemotaxis protein
VDRILAEIATAVEQQGGATREIARAAAEASLAASRARGGRRGRAWARRRGRPRAPPAQVRAAATEVAAQGPALRAELARVVGELRAA